MWRVEYSRKADLELLNRRNRAPDTNDMTSSEVRGPMRQSLFPLAPPISPSKIVQMYVIFGSFSRYFR